MVQVRRTRKVHLIEHDPVDTEQQQGRKDAALLAASLRFTVPECFAYPETIPAAEEVVTVTDTAPSCENIFAVKYDGLSMKELQHLLESITPQSVVVARQERELSRGSVSPVDVKVEVYLNVGLIDVGDHSTDDRKGYTYAEMLSRIVEDLNRNNEGSSRSGQNKVPTPKLESVGKKKTCIINFQRICEAIHRSVDDVKEFMERELSCKGSLDSKNAFTLKYQMTKSTDMDKLLHQYLDTYVKCNSCNCIDTVLEKNGRLMELRCNVCTATRTVVSGNNSASYSAVVEKRSRIRAAATTL